MSTIQRTSILLGALALAVSLGGCISSPLPGGTVGSLYQWDDLETPVLTTVGIDAPARKGFFDGDFDLSGVAKTHPELSARPDQPWLFEACNDITCYSVVLFSNDFRQDAAGLLSGDVSMNAMTTLMANEVRGRPADSVRATLDAMAADLSFPKRKADYAALIALDLRRDERSRDYLLYPDLYDEAVALHRDRPASTVKTLLGKEIAKTGDLEVPSDFDFDSSWALTVDIDLPTYAGNGAYLLLCSDFDSDGAGVTVDYTSCPLKTPLQAGAWQGEVKLTGGVTALAAVVLPLNDPNRPEVAVWDRAVDGERLIWR